ncbi:hypothetical protein Hanom_Chr03g00212271 [Helianthus anomalus]|nr:hypothetical protein HanPSC8_Chr11g0454691 [Helianthus annuus]
MKLRNSVSFLFKIVSDVEKLVCLICNFSDDELIRMFIWDNGGGEAFLLVKETQYEEESLR